MRRQIFRVLTIFWVLLLIGCISAPQPPRPKETPPPEAASDPGEPELPDFKEYPGWGESTSLLGSMQGAKADAIRKGVVDLIGAAKEQANSGDLNEVLYSPQRQNRYAEIVGDSSKDKVGENYMYEANFNVNLKAIKDTLIAKNIIGGGEPTGLSTSESLVSTEMGDEFSTEEPAAVTENYEPTAEERKFINSYLERMTILVTVPDSVNEKKEFKDTAINSANQFLVQRGYNVIDLEQLEEIKRDQQVLFEEETGESMSMIQWIAQKLNADIYIELDFSIELLAEMGGKYKGMATINGKAYEASTGEIVGNFFFTQDKGKASISRESGDTARFLAVKGVTYEYIMPNLLKQMVGKMEKLLSRGIRYEVIIQYPANDREMSKFFRKLNRDIKGYSEIYYSETEAKYEVWYIGSITDLKNSIYDASESVPLLESMYAVATRGKSITFNSGL